MLRNITFWVFSNFFYKNITVTVKYKIIVHTLTPPPHTHTPNWQGRQMAYVVTKFVNKIQIIQFNNTAKRFTQFNYYSSFISERSRPVKTMSSNIFMVTRMRLFCEKGPIKTPAGKDSVYFIYFSSDFVLNVTIFNKCRRIQRLLWFVFLTAARPKKYVLKATHSCCRTL